jgi:hypothetical protein
VCGPACLLMIGEMAIGSGTYSGRAGHPHSGEA